MIISHYSFYGGAGISLIDIINMLKDKYELVVYTNGIGNKEFFDALNETNVRYEVFKAPPPTYSYYSGSSSIFSYGFWRGLLNYKNVGKWLKILVVENPEVVILNSSVLAPMGKIIKDLKMKAICFVRETFVEGKYNLRTKVMLRMLNNSMDGVCFISNYDRTFASLKKPKTKVIADTVGERFYRVEKNTACNKLGLDPKRFNILYTGGFSEIKGIDVILKSLRYLNNIDFTLIIAGNKEYIHTIDQKLLISLLYLVKPRRYFYQRNVRRLIESYEDSEKIKFIGLQKNMSLAYSCSDVLVVPHNKPHQSRPAFEAGFFKLPVIIADFRQTAEYFQNMFNCVTFKHKNPMDLAKKIEFLYHNQDLRTELGNNNYLMTMTYHNFHIEKKKLWHFIETILNENKKSS